MRVGILLTSNDLSDFANRFPNDGEKFATLLRPIRPAWEFRVYRAIDGDFPTSIHDHDGYVVTGSPASVHDPHPWIAQLLEFVRQVHAATIPLIGACFGHQAIALALGGTVEYNPQGWVVGTADTRFEKRDWMEPYEETLALYAAHKEQVTKLPSDAQRIGETLGCPNAAFVIGNHIATTEYHPEMPEQFMLELIPEMGDELSLDQQARARAQISAGARGPTFAQWMVNFLEMPRNRQS